MVSYENRLAHLRQCALLPPALLDLIWSEVPPELQALLTYSQCDLRAVQWLDFPDEGRLGLASHKPGEVGAWLNLNSRTIHFVEDGGQGALEDEATLWLFVLEPVITMVCAADDVPAILARPDGWVDAARLRGVLQEFGGRYAANLVDRLCS